MLNSGVAINLKLSVGYGVMACISLILDVLAAGSDSFGVVSVIQPAEWRLAMYKHSQTLFDVLFELVSPLEQPDFDGEFGLFHLLDLACQTINMRVSYEYFGATFSMSNIFLTRKFIFIYFFLKNCVKTFLYKFC